MEKKRKGGPAAVVTVAAAVLVLLSFGPGSGFGDGGGSGNGEAKDPGTVVQLSQTETPARYETEPETVPEKQVILVTISENDYLCDNQKYTLEELMEYLTGLEGEIMVEIREDNASLRASRDLADSLSDHGILFAQQQ